MYRVKLYHLQRNVKFIIMNSVFDTDKVLQAFFDLKGSSLGREAKPGQSVKKDNDVRKGFPDSVFSLHPIIRQRMRNQLFQDLEFLKRMKIMDYSMVGFNYLVVRASAYLPFIICASWFAIGFCCIAHRSSSYTLSSVHHR